MISEFDGINFFIDSNVKEKSKSKWNKEVEIFNRWSEMKSTEIQEFDKVAIPEIKLQHLSLLQVDTSVLSNGSRSLGDVPRICREDLIDEEALDVRARRPDASRSSLQEKLRIPAWCASSRPDARFFLSSSAPHLSPASSFTLELVYCSFPVSRKLVFAAISNVTLPDKHSVDLDPVPPV